MEKKAFLRAEHVAMAIAIYVAGFILTFLVYVAQGMANHVFLLEGNPWSEAARWPLALVEWVI